MIDHREQYRHEQFKQEISVLLAACLHGGLQTMLAWDAASPAGILPHLRPENLAYEVLFRRTVDYYADRHGIAAQELGITPAHVAGLASICQLHSIWQFFGAAVARNDDARAKFEALKTRFMKRHRMKEAAFAHIFHTLLAHKQTLYLVAPAIKPSPGHGLQPLPLAS